MKQAYTDMSCEVVKLCICVVRGFNMLHEIFGKKPFFRTVSCVRWGKSFGVNRTLTRHCLFLKGEGKGGEEADFAGLRTAIKLTMLF